MFAAHGLLRILVKAAKQSPAKAREFLHSKFSYTRFTQATCKFNKKRPCARFKNEIWCMILAYVDKLAKDNIGVKHLLDRQDLLDRTVDAKRVKTKDTKETKKTFSKVITKSNRPKAISMDRGTEFPGDFKIYWNAEKIKLYSTMSETKVAFPERLMRSLKIIL